MKVRLESLRLRNDESAPTLGEMDISLSLSTTMRFLFRSPAWLRASKAIPPVMLPSPMTAMARCGIPFREFATRDAQSSGDGSAGMPGAECVVLALRSLGESADSVELPQGVKLGVPSGEEFMGVRLMSHIPNDVVVRRVEDVMQGNSQFNDSQIRGKMSAVFCDGADDRVTNFLGQLLKLSGRNFFIAMGCRSGKARSFLLSFSRFNLSLSSVMSDEQRAMEKRLASQPVNCIAPSTHCSLLATHYFPYV